MLSCTTNPNNKETRLVVNDSTKKSHPALIDYRAGLDLLGRHRFQEALVRFRRCVEKDPDFLDSHFRLATTLRRIGDYEKAWESISACLRLSRRDPEMVREAAELALLLGKSKECIRLTEQQVLLDPRNNSARARLILFSYQFEGPRKTIRLVEKSIREKPRWVDGYYYLGHLLEITGDPAAAEDAYSMALEFDPNRSRTLQDLRRIWRGISLEENPLRTESAKFFMEEADRLLRAGITEPGLKAIESWGAAFPDQPQLTERVVEARMQRHQFEQALKLIESVPKENFTLKLHYLRGRILSTAERFHEAAEVYRSLRLEDPRSEEAWVGEIEALLQADELRLAAETAASAVDRVADRPRLWFLFATIASLVGNNAQTIASLEKTIALDPDHEPALFALGIEYLKSGKPDRAIPPFRDLVSLNGDHVEAWRHLAIAYSEMRAWGDALAGWHRVLHLVPEDEQARKNIPRIEGYLRVSPAPRSVDPSVESKTQ